MNAQVITAAPHNVHLSGAQFKVIEVQSIAVHEFLKDQYFPPTADTDAAGSLLVSSAEMVCPSLPNLN